MSADNDAAVKAAITVLPEEAWRPLRTQDEMTADRKGAETVHSTNRGQAAFRLIILRWRESLFADTSHSHGIATTRLDETPEAVVWRYNERAHIAHHINELKRGVGNVTANAMPFAIGVVPDSLFLAQRLLTMPADWQRTTIRRIRWLLVEVGGKLITHGRALILKLAASVQQYRLYQEMRRRTYALSSA